MKLQRQLENGTWVDVEADEVVRHADAPDQMVRCRGCGKTLPVSEAKVTRRWASCYNCFAWVTLYL